MARQKKIVKYVPQTELPKRNGEYRLLERDGMTPTLLMGFLKENAAQYRKDNPDTHYIPYSSHIERWDSGELNDNNFISIVGEWRYKRMCNIIFRLTPTFKRINEAFMEEYNRREDLQELYRETVKNNNWMYDQHENCVQTDASHPFKTTPETFAMFQWVASQHTARSMVETAREVPFQEGDLVALRKPAVDSDADPYRVTRWSTAAHEGKTTPGPDVPRIGTVIAITDQLSQSWRPVKGSKVLKILWMGTDSSNITDVEMRWVKWLERPTLKNGLKVRPTE